MILLKVSCLCAKKAHIELIHLDRKVKCLYYHEVFSSMQLKKMKDTLSNSITPNFFEVIFN